MSKRESDVNENENKLYKTKTVLAVTGISRHVLDQWLQKGIIVPEVTPRRRGCASEYSVNNMFQLMLTERLANSGLALKVASAICIELVDLVEEAEVVLSDEPILIVVNLKDAEKREYFPVRYFDPTDLYEISLVVRVDKIYQSVLERLEEL